MQDVKAEREFYSKLFARDPENEHIVGGYDEIHALAMPEVPDGLVLDLGCGTGAHAVRLARRGASVVAIDLTRQGVCATRDRMARQGLDGLLVVADAEHLPLRDQSVSVAWTALLLHHFPNVDAVASELARVVVDRITALEPNALNGLTWFANNVVNRFLGIPAMTPNQRALTPRRLDKTFRRHGFTQVAVHYLDRRWRDRLGWIRSSYGFVTAGLPLRFRANKFLVIMQKHAV